MKKNTEYNMGDSLQNPHKFQPTFLFLKKSNQTF
jgi:hypothetical protein